MGYETKKKKWQNNLFCFQTVKNVFIPDPGLTTAKDIQGCNDIKILINI